MPRLMTKLLGPALSLMVLAGFACSKSETPAEDTKSDESTKAGAATSAGTETATAEDTGADTAKAGASELSDDAGAPRINSREIFSALPKTKDALLGLVKDGTLDAPSCGAILLAHADCKLRKKQADIDPACYARLALDEITKSIGSDNIHCSLPAIYEALGDDNAMARMAGFEALVTHYEKLAFTKADEVKILNYYDIETDPLVAALSFARFTGKFLRSSPTEKVCDKNDCPFILNSQEKLVELATKHITSDHLPAQQDLAKFLAQMREAEEAVTEVLLAAASKQDDKFINDICPSFSWYATDSAIETLAKVTQKPKNNFGRKNCSDSLVDLWIHPENYITAINPNTLEENDDPDEVKALQQGLSEDAYFAIADLMKTENCTEVFPFYVYYQGKRVLKQKGTLAFSESDARSGYLDGITDILLSEKCTEKPREHAVDLLLGYDIPKSELRTWKVIIEAETDSKTKQSLLKKIDKNLTSKKEDDLDKLLISIENEADPAAAKAALTSFLDGVDAAKRDDKLVELAQRVLFRSAHEDAKVMEAFQKRLGLSEAEVVALAERAAAKGVDRVAGGACWVLASFETDSAKAVVEKLVQSTKTESPRDGCVMARARLNGDPIPDLTKPVRNSVPGSVARFNDKKQAAYEREYLEDLKRSYPKCFDKYGNWNDDCDGWNGPPPCIPAHDPWNHGRLSHDPPDHSHPNCRDVDCDHCWYEHHCKENDCSDDDDGG